MTKPSGVMLALIRSDLKNCMAQSWPTFAIIGQLIVTIKHSNRCKQSIGLLWALLA
jgi:hypothetical protein